MNVDKQPEKRHLPRAVILTPTRTIGFRREPVQDDELVGGVILPSLDNRYVLGRDATYIDARRRSGDR